MLLYARVGLRSAVGSLVITIGAILLIIGFVTGVAIVCTIGIIGLVIDLALWLPRPGTGGLSASGRLPVSYGPLR